MVSDSQTSGEGVKVNCRKTYRIKGWLVGAAGRVDDIEAIVEHVKGSDTIKGGFSSVKSSKLKLEEEVEFLVLSPGGKIYVSENGAPLYEVTDSFCAIGSGAQGALVAMNLGCSPSEAVKQVMKVDPMTGGRLYKRKL